jgi:hypothetical protein
MPVEQNRITHSCREKPWPSFGHVNIFIYTCTEEYSPYLQTINRWSRYSQAQHRNRLERWSLRLQPYDVTIRYQPGTENPADYLSRHPLRDVTPNSRQEKVAEEFVNFLAETSTPKAINLTDLKSATRNDATLQAVMKALQTGKWHETSKDARINISDFQSFEKVRNELCTLPDLVLREHRIVIPEALREKVIDIAHEGHMGLVKTQALIREKVWFPKISRLVEEKVKSCLACQVTTLRNTKEPLQMSELPKQPWTELSMDFGRRLLVLMSTY